ncbi:hypothetical protein U9W89_004713 [Enterobacter asburiae]|uniref:hypothetical protein n=1 Tax=Enterobacter asburiae TaxID=61645 RepID=UPI00227942F9|nr:hypothetical protein [Enterobacter asburiae]MCY1150491.1 hypothetical protein [Enterobacter asburiae]
MNYLEFPDGSLLWQQATEVNMTVERMKRPWNVVGAGFNDDGVYFTFDDTTIHRADVRLMEAAPDLLEACLRSRNQLYAAGYEPKAGSMNPAECLLAQLNAAISKALGEE